MSSSSELFALCPVVFCSAVVVVCGLFQGSSLRWWSVWFGGSFWWVRGPVLAGSLNAAGLILVRSSRRNRTRRTGTRPDSDSQLAFPPELKGRIKTRWGHFFLGVCVCVCGASLLSRNCISVDCSLYIACIFVRTLLCVSLPIINKSLLNVPVRCPCFLSLA